MSWWTRKGNRGRIEEELDAELRDHVERQVADYVRAGMSAGEARRRARLEFGGLDQVKEICRDVRGTRWIEETWQDLRFAVRLLVKERWFAAAAILALGLGIGLTSTAFTVYNAVLVRGLPVDDPSRIMALAMYDADGRERGISYLDFQDWRAAATSFMDIAAYSEPAMDIGDPGMATERFFGARVTANAFRLLGMEPMLGRDFLADDDRPGAPAVVMLGHGVWTNRYEADPEVLGRVIRVNDAPATVIGVMPAGFEFPQWAELWQPLWPTPGLVDHARDKRSVRAVGRLENGVTVTRAQVDLAAAAAGLAATYPETNEGFRPRVDPFNEHYNGTFRPVLTALMFAAGIVLLVACANAANLLLARAARRSREVGMRVSLGATRARIVRQLLVECVMLAGLAGVFGLGLAVLCARLLSMSFEPLMAPFWIDFAIDGRVLAFLTVTCLSTSLIFGLAPALHTSKANVRDLVKPAGRAGTGGRPLRGWMWWLVPAELALTLVLLAGAGLMARSLLTLALADRIIDSAGVTSIQLLLPEARYPTAEQRVAFFRTLDEQVAASPSISSATRAGALPFAPMGAAPREFALDRQPASDGDPPPTARVTTIANDYFQALGLRLQRGRAFTDRDGTTGNDSVIINRRFADLFFGNDDPLGRRIRLMARGEPAGDAPWLTIVGISPTVRQTMSGAPGPVAYLPYPRGTDSVPAPPRAQRARRRRRGRDDAEHRRTARPGPHDHARVDAGRCARADALHPASDRLAARRLRLGRSGPVGRRPVRCDRVCRDAAYAGDWRTNGARRASGPGWLAGAAAWTGAARRRVRDRHLGRAHDRQAVRELARRHGADRSGHAAIGRGAARRRGGGRVPLAGAARGAARSAGRAASRVAASRPEPRPPSEGELH